MPIDGTGWKYSDNMEYKDYNGYKLTHAFKFNILPGSK